MTPQPDRRSPQRRALDEAIAAEPPLPPLDLASEAIPSVVEEHMMPRRRPLAVVGIVENGVVRPLDATVQLPEHSRVIIVAAE